ncbi:Aspartate carbamoyltransferase regulatory chain [Methanocorpusculaceae archaeon Sp1]|uniref:Aspartate carbamoyltransferase regulatory chain n=1 Tax=Methanorbis furvi TaxID=3028299 RepID=A0AAE4MBY4_9EURY|nr:Aspartate carbamoyltransferase regulatory chain [Methanocorpusculaceae archaeon Sp1]MDV0441316.1 Aspartate carbamoyltransferase regulatory chain [Methanocorpusculaceae archaeon Ag1]
MKRSSDEGIVISPIKNGTVIDHITPGEGLTVIRILGIQDGTNVTFTVATNVVSSRGGRKDMVKIENRELVKSEVDKLALIAPDAKISIIRDSKVVEKKSVEVPTDITGVIKCPNPNCITNTREPAESRFTFHSRGFRCCYCDTVISREMDIGDYI